METLTIKIKGMSCGGCVKSITSVLQAITGVSNVDVSLEENRATISYDPAMAKAKPALTQFNAAIEDAGFDVV